jgi:hypothetical protein
VRCISYPTGVVEFVGEHKHASNLLLWGGECRRRKENQENASLNCAIHAVKSILEHPSARITDGSGRAAPVTYYDMEKTLDTFWTRSGGSGEKAN